MNATHASTDTATGTDAEPLLIIEHGALRLTLLGTAHVSRASAEKVSELLAGGSYDAVAVELCPSRHNAIVNPDALARMNLFQVFREKKAALVTANLALGAYQQRMAEQLGVTPGAEMHAAVAGARARHLPVLLIDREISITLKRIYRSVRWWQRAGLIAGLLGSVTSRRSISEEEIERLKQGDMLESIFASPRGSGIYVPLIAERDRYRHAAPARKSAPMVIDVLVVIGAGHLRGLRQHHPKISAGRSQRSARLAELDQVHREPLPRAVGVVALILAGFALGFMHNPQLGAQMVSTGSQRWSRRARRDDRQRPLSHHCQRLRRASFAQSMVGAGDRGAGRDQLRKPEVDFSVATGQSNCVAGGATRVTHTAGPCAAHWISGGACQPAPVFSR